MFIPLMSTIIIIIIVIIIISTNLEEVLTYLSTQDLLPVFVL